MRRKQKRDDTKQKSAAKKASHGGLTKLTTSCAEEPSIITRIQNSRLFHIMKTISLPIFDTLRVGNEYIQ